MGMPFLCSNCIMLVSYSPNWKRLILWTFKFNALLLLRQCGSFCKLVHLGRSRCIPLSLKADGLEYFDNDVYHCFALSTAVDTTKSAWKQAQLSLSRGGLGLFRLSEHSSACYIVSLSMAGMSSESNQHLLTHAINKFNE